MSDNATKKPPRTFPIQRAGRVPWEVAEQAYIGYAKEYGERQTLERLGERGGFGVEEMDRFYPEWRSTTQLIVGLRAENERMAEAAAIAARYGMIDGAHHKQWVIDQMLRKMLGPSGYADWVDEMNSDPEYDPWDAGIAP